MLGHRGQIWLQHSHTRSHTRETFLLNCSYIELVHRKREHCLYALCMKSQIQIEFIQYLIHI